MHERTNELTDADHTTNPARFGFLLSNAREEQQSQISQGVGW